VSFPEGCDAPGSFLAAAPARRAPTFAAPGLLFAGDGAISARIVKVMRIATGEEIETLPVASLI
jgi:hypothetical protein